MDDNSACRQHPHLGRTAIVTGAAQGIGQAIAARLYKSGWNLAVMDANADVSSAVEQHDHTRVLPCVVDVTDETEVDAHVRSVSAHYGSIDLVVTCAGIHRGGPSATFHIGDFRTVMEVNVTGTFSILKAALPLMKAGGRVITISSELALTGAPEQAAYCASKGAVTSLTKALAREFAPKGILINSVAPGPTATEMLLAVESYASGEEAKALPLKRYGTPEEIAAVVEALAGEAGTYMVGQVISPNGGAVI